MISVIPEDPDPQFEALKASIKEGLDELDRGEGRPLDFEEIKRKGRERLATIPEIEQRNAGSHDHLGS